MAFENLNPVQTKQLVDPVESTYIRVLKTLDPNGIDMIIDAYFYGSKEHFKGGVTNLLKVDFASQWKVKYDRFIDGVDELKFAHDYVKTKLLELPDWTKENLTEIDIEVEPQA